MRNFESAAESAGSTPPSSLMMPSTVGRNRAGTGYLASVVACADPEVTVGCHVDGTDPTAQLRICLNSPPPVIVSRRGRDPVVASECPQRPIRGIDEPSRIRHQSVIDSVAKPIRFFGIGFGLSAHDAPILGQEPFRSIGRPALKMDAPNGLPPMGPVIEPNDLRPFASDPESAVPGLQQSADE